MTYCPDCDEYFNEEDLDGDLYCPGCGKHWNVLNAVVQ